MELRGYPPEFHEKIQPFPRRGLFITGGLKDGQARGLKDEHTRGLKDGQTRGLKDGQTRGLKDGQARELKDGQTMGPKELPEKGVWVMRLHRGPKDPHCSPTRPE